MSAGLRPSSWVESSTTTPPARVPASSLPAELVAELRHFPVEGAEPVLVRRGEVGAGAHEVLVVSLDHQALQRIEAQAGAAVVEGLDPLEQGVVERDGVPMRGHSGRQGPLDGLQGVVRVGGGEAAEDALHTAEQLARALEREDRVLERRRGAFVDDGLHLGELLAHPLFDGRLEVGVVDAVERRRLVEQRAGRREGIAAGKLRAGAPAPAEQDLS